MKLGDVVTLQRGHDLPTERRRAGAVPILGSFGLTGWHDEWKAPGPGVTVGRSGASFGVVSFSPDDYWPLNTALYVTDFHGNDERFAYYLLSAFDFSSFNSGSAQPSLNRNFIHPVPVAVPRLADQQAIASILGALDDKIDLNRRMSETLEGMARALFASWFGESSPRGPGPPGARNAQRGLVESVLADYSTLNPESWTKGSRPRVIRYVDLAAVKWGRMDTPTRHTEDAPSRAQQVLRPGDTIVGTVRPGNGSYALVSDDGLTGSTAFAVLRPHRPGNRAFVYLASTSPANIDSLAHLADGAAYPAVRPEVIAMTSVIRVPDPVLAEFAAKANPLLDRFAQSERESRTLAALRDTLLPRLISGELRVPDAERIAVDAGA